MKQKALISTILSVFLLLFTLSCLGSCSVREPVFREDVELKTVQKEIDGLLYHTDSLISYEPDDVRFYLELPDEYCSDCIVRAQTSSTSIDEYGIFHCKNTEDAEQLEELLIAYLERSLEGKREWLQSYNPSELEKLKKSRVERYGSYVFYGVLDPPTERLAIERVEELLREV